MPQSITGTLYLSLALRERCCLSAGLPLPLPLPFPCPLLGPADGDTGGGGGGGGGEEETREAGAEDVMVGVDWALGT